MFSPPQHLTQSPSHTLCGCTFLRQWIKLGALPLIALGLSACGDDDDDVAPNPDAPTHVQRVHQNNLPDSETSLVSALKKSPINWQSWSPQVFEDARAEKKTIFLVIGNSMDASTRAILDKINQSQKTVHILNQQHVCIFADSHTQSDLNYFVNLICLKSGYSLSPTTFVWFSYEGNPISWTPASLGSHEDTSELVSRMSSTVTNIWRENPDYVLQNSRDDFQRRASHVFPTKTEDDESYTLLSSVRKLSSLFDPTTNTVDGLLHTNPSQYINLMLEASNNKHISESQRKKHRAIAIATADTALIQGLIDPLDGGCFNAIQNGSYSMPAFSKTIRSQCESMIALDALYQETSNPTYRAAAEGIRNYISKHLLRPDGSCSTGIAYSKQSALDNTCVWTLEELEAALTAQELSAVKITYNIKGLGNVPLDADRSREYFRKNILVPKTTAQETATQLNITLEECKSLLQSAAKKLAKIRSERSPKPIREDLVLTRNMAHLVSAYTHAYRCTHDTAHLDQAIKAMRFIQQKLTHPQGLLLRSSLNGKSSGLSALASDLATVCRAAISLYECSLDRSWITYATKLHKQIIKEHTHPETGLIRENATPRQPVDFVAIQFISITRTNNPHTLALVADNARILAEHGAIPNPKELLKAIDDQIQSINFRASLSGLSYIRTKLRAQQSTIILKAPASDDTLKAAHRSPLPIIELKPEQKSPLLGDTTFPADAIALIHIPGEEKPIIIRSVQELTQHTQSSPPQTTQPE